MKQNSHISDERLSRYLDDEISASEKPVIEKHLKECECCRNRLEQFDFLHEAILRSPEPAMGSDVWASINNQIDSSVKTNEQKSRYKRWVAVAAVFLVVFTSGWLALGQQFNGFLAGPETTAFVNPFAFDYGLYLSGLNEPELMQQFNEGYKRQRVKLEEAVSALGLQSDSRVFSNLPPSLSMESVYLLDSACCKCLQITLKHDGQQITIFQQPKKHPAEFTGYHIKHTKVDSADCSKVEAKDHTALTFDSGEAKYVVVGKQNDPIMATIMHRLANNQ